MNGLKAISAKMAETQNGKFAEIVTSNKYWYPPNHKPSSRCPDDYRLLPLVISL
jgi:hypothetical protein